MHIFPLFPDPSVLEHTLMTPQGYPVCYSQYKEDWMACAQFLINYKYAYETYKSYRRDVERFMLWFWNYYALPMEQLEVQHIQKYIDFMGNIPSEWCMASHARRYLDAEQQQMNPVWRPFIRMAKHQKIQVKATLAILSAYFQYLVDHDRMRKNPIKMLKQKKHLAHYGQPTRVVRKLSASQWRLVMELAEKNKNLSWHGCRNWWMLGLFYLLGLRISEVATTPRHIPTMQDFWMDSHGHWWFRALGKGNKIREIAVPIALIDMLMEVRVFLGLSRYLVVGERTPLLPKIKGQGGLGIRHVRACMEQCFSYASECLRRMGQEEDALHLEQATVHWLRHTSISDAVKFRPLEHVRDDAGHSSIMITDIYVDSDRMERHKSAQKKVITGYDEEL